jgi:hypothetical protein
MYLAASRVLIFAFAVVAIAGPAFAQTTPPQHVPLQKTKVVVAADLRSPLTYRRASSCVCRQDLFDRNNMNNLRSDWPGPPAQPAQF